MAYPGKRSSISASRTTSGSWWTMVTIRSMAAVNPRSSNGSFSRCSCLTSAASVADTQDAWSHVEYLLQRPFQNVDEWLGPEGDEWRRRCMGAQGPSEQFKTGWVAFRDAHRDATLADIEAEHEALCAGFKEAKAAGVIESNERRRPRAKRHVT